MPENGTHGSIGGRWQRRQTKRGLLVPGRCAGKRHPMAWTGSQPQQSVVRASGLPHRSGWGVGSRGCERCFDGVRVRIGGCRAVAGCWVAVMV